MNFNKLPKLNEISLSQLPAMEVLHKLGWKYLTQAEIAEQRESSSHFLLSGVLAESLRKLNGKELSEEDISSLIGRLGVSGSSLISNNIEVYKMLADGVSLDKSQSQGENNFRHCQYIDWENTDNNSFHFTCEFSASQETGNIRLDILLFINGIPMVAIECKAPEKEIGEARGQLNEYQKKVPGLFAFIQMVIAVNNKEAEYSNIGSTGRWNKWREQDEATGSMKPQDIKNILKKEIPSDVLQLIEQDLRQAKHKESGASKSNQLTQQNQQIIFLLRPDRFTELIKRFTIIGDGIKKIAMAHQYFVVKSAIARVQKNTDTPDTPTNTPTNNPVKRRQGGVIWHTQGSGKSISMILLINNLKYHLGTEDPRVVLVSDRIDLNDQMKDNLNESNIDFEAAKNGSHLRELIKSSTSVILTNVHKFSNAWTNDERHKQFFNPSNNIFLLVDECHRTQYGDYARDMRRLIPNACYIGFTGTPLLEKYKQKTFRTFGEFIQPTYPIQEALIDKTIVPLYYQPRPLEVDANADEIDKGWEEAAIHLRSVEELYLKRKYSDIGAIRNLEKAISAIAKDIADHYKKYVRTHVSPDKDIKAQLVVARKSIAILYHRELQKHKISSKVVISPPSDISDEDRTDSINKQEEIKLVEEFWNEEVGPHDKNGIDYERQVIKDFKDNPEPQILIVVDKLITGFDAPKNTILYLCKRLRDHTLLQAIARVNRLSPGKKNGLIVDYMLLFPDLKEAINAYDELRGYNSADLEGTLHTIEDALEAFDSAYQKLKESLGIHNEMSVEEIWDKLLRNMQNDKWKADFLKTYKDLRDYYSILVSTSSFNDKYKGQEFQELVKYMKCAAECSQYMHKVGYQISQGVAVAEKLMTDVLNENLEIEAKPIGKEIDAYDSIRLSTPENEEGDGDEDGYGDGEESDDDEDDSKPSGVRESIEVYLSGGSKRGSTGGGFTTGISGIDKNPTWRARGNMEQIKNKVKDTQEAHPNHSLKMSEIIQQAIAEVEQLSLIYEESSRELQEENAETSRKLREKLAELEELQAKKNALAIPNCLQDHNDALEYFYSHKRILIKLISNHNNTEHEIGKTSIDKQKEQEQELSGQPNTKPQSSEISIADLESTEYDYPELEEELCDMAKDTYQVLEGEDNSAWWYEVDSEKRTRLQIKLKIWDIETICKKILGKDSNADIIPPADIEKYTDEILNIARARFALANTKAA